MPIVISDFEIVPDAEPVPAPATATQVASKRLTPHEVALALRREQERAARVRPE